MKLKWSSRHTTIALGVVSAVVGLDISYTGVTRAGLLGEERYFVGGLLIVFGVYCLFVALKDKQRDKQSK
jgi:putative Mn2+ efflux pump MntP